MALITVSGGQIGTTTEACDRLVERVKAFTDLHPLEGGEGYGAPKQLLDEIVSRLGSHGMEQESGGRLERAQVVLHRNLSQELRELHLRPIAQVARALAEAAPTLAQAVPTLLTACGAIYDRALRFDLPRRVIRGE